MEGIAPIFINPQNGGFVASEIRLGSRGDSYYEYLLKWVLFDSGALTHQTVPSNQP